VLLFEHIKVIALTILPWFWNVRVLNVGYMYWSVCLRTLQYGNNQYIIIDCHILSLLKEHYEKQIPMTEKSTYLLGNPKYLNENCIFT
jgi:hypothetical protein